MPNQPGAVSGNNSVCFGNEIYSAAAENGISYLWSLNGGGSTTPNENTVFVSWYNQGTYELSVTPYNFCGNGIAQTFSVSVSDIPAQPSLISGSENPCISTTEIYSVTANAGTTYSWNLSEGGTISQSENEITADWTSSGSHTITATPENQCGIGESWIKNVLVKNIPNTAVFAEFDAETCLGTANYAVNSESGTSYSWAVSGSNTISGNGNSAVAEWLLPGQYEVSVLPANECGTALPSVISVEIFDVPAQPAAVSGNNSVCFGNEIYSAAAENGISYLWSLNGGGSTTPNENTVFVSWYNQGTYELSVTPYNFCGNGIPQSFLVSVSDIPAQPSLISGSENPCISTTEIYSVTANAGITYSWNLSEAGTILQSENEISADWTSGGSHTITVTPENQCGIGESRIKTVSVKTSPGQIYFTQEETESCIGSEIFAVNSISGASYVWKINDKIQPSETNTLLVDFTQQGDFLISVNAANDCGSGMEISSGVSILKIPGQPEIITGESLACIENLSYSTNYETNTNYRWMLSGGGSLNAFQNTALVNWSGTGVYTLETEAYNRCGTSERQSLEIQVETAPSAFAEISGETKICRGTEEIYSVQSAENLSYSWELNGTEISSENGNSAALFWAASGFQTLSVTPENRCGQGTSASLAVVVSDTLPQISGEIHGEKIVCILSTEYYATDNDDNLNFFWSLTNGGELTDNENIAIIDWLEAGNHEISVYAKNNCGESEIKSAEIQVETEPALPEISFRNDTLLSSAASGNQWFFNGVALENEQENFLIPAEAGNYSLTVANACSESLISKEIIISDRKFAPFGISIFPVPAQNEDVTILIPVNLGWSEISVYDSYGKIVKTISDDDSQKIVFPAGSLPAGNYLFSVKTESGIAVFKVLVLR